MVSASDGSVWDLIKQFDAYPKTLEDFRIKTLGGGAITVMSAIVMLLLFTSEIRDYLTPEVNEELFVDTSRGEKLKINLDFVFERVSCDYLGLDAMDVSGEQHIDIEHNIFKRRLDLDGKPIEDPQREHSVGETAKITNKTSDTGSKELVKCGSCYGAETEDRKCCNTCQEVQEAYRRKSWKFDAKGVEQCAGGLERTEQEERALKEGCQIYGYLEVNRVGGSFHIAPGKSFSINHVHVHDVQPFSSSDFNLTHRIRHLSFGRQVENVINPLDGVRVTADKGAAMYQYHIKIVPTMYARPGDDSVFLSNQFSVTRHQKVVSAMSGESGMPGVFFNYELAPVMVKYSEKKKSFGHFATGLCAIIGGVFTVAGILDKLVYTSSRILQQKIELGKAT